MTRQEIVDQAKAQGFSHILTAGGPVALDSWTPYGKADGHTVSFRIENDRVHEDTEDARGQGLTMGLWTLLPPGEAGWRLG